MKPSVFGGRGVQFADIRQALATCAGAVLQNNGRWRMEGGTDLDSEPLTLVCAMDNGTLVVTVY